MNDIQSKIIDKISTLTGRKLICEDAQIYYDLWISGDDAIDLISQITAYGVDMSDFKFERYFPDENESLVEYWVSRIGILRKRKPLSVRHLLEVVRKGRWSDPPSSGSK